MKSLLLLLTRLCVGWGLSPRLLGFLAVVALVLLRLSVGWHFITEGVDKRDALNWSAGPFFAGAKGPLAEEFRKLVWDGDGSYRLNRDDVMVTMALYRDQVVRHFGFDEAQKTQAQVNYANAVNRYDWVRNEYAIEIEEFELGRQRVNAMATNDREKLLRDGVSSLAGQRDAIRREWMQQGAPALRQIDAIFEIYQGEQNQVATPEQLRDRGQISLVRPRTNFIDTSVVDPFVPWFDIVIGTCLLVGLFTPVAALAAAGFLFSVFLSQLPPTAGPLSTHQQLVESMACILLAAAGAGRFAGLDFFLHLICRKVYFKRSAIEPAG